MNLDVFKGDGFSLQSLTDIVVKLPYAPTRIGRLGLFVASGITTTSIEVESKAGTLSLVANKDRGVPGSNIIVPKRELRTFRTMHLPQPVSMMADEVQNIRAFGKESEEELATDRLSEKLAIATGNLDVTAEWHRMGAIKGIVYDSDGTTAITNLFTEFGVAQNTHNLVLSVTTTSIITECLAIKRKIEAELGGMMYTNIRVLCSSGFFDSFTTHAMVVDAYRLYNQSSMLRSDNRSGFQFAEMTWEEYRGNVSGQEFVEANCAYAIPEGVPGMFVTKYAPANYMDTVNTVGLPRYAARESMDFNKGVNFEVQSNPLHLNLRPRAVVKLTKS